jgi:hypothetical protein
MRLDVRDDVGGCNGCLPTGRRPALVFACERKRLCLDWSSRFNERFSAIHGLGGCYTETRC